jgi:hypothetical protein
VGERTPWSRDDKNRCVFSGHLWHTADFPAQPDSKGIEWPPVGARSSPDWQNSPRKKRGKGADRPHRIGRTERAPSAGLLGCVSACVAAGLNLASEGKKRRRLQIAFKVGVSIRTADGTYKQ